MLKENKLVRGVVSVVVPFLLLGLAIFQIHRCNNIINLRNPYVFEQLLGSADQVWDSLSGKQILSNGLGKPFQPVQNGSNHKAVLWRDLPPFTVHYLWCVDGHFELNHYVTILSAIYALQPDQVIIHYRTKPRADPQGYWRWLEDLQRDVIMLTLRPLQDPSSCHYDLDKVGADFSDHVGVFIMGDVVITNMTRAGVIQRMTTKPSKDSGNSLRKRHQLFLVSSIEPYAVSENSEHSVITCSSLTDVYNPRNVYPPQGNCVSLNKYLHAEEILKINTTFNRSLRKMLYGSEYAVQGKKYSTVQIPNIVHVILQDNVKELSPVHYISIKSAFIKAHIETVYVHARRQPYGKLWDRLYDKDDLNVKYIPCHASAHTDIKHPYMMYALYTLLQHGGVAHFGDVVFMSPISKESRLARSAISPHYSRYRLRHRSINTDIIAAAKGSEFVEAMLGMVRQKRDTSPEVRVDDIASHVVEQHPESVALVGRLTSHQVCRGSVCEMEGGHFMPQLTFTTRLLWKTGAPSTLEDLKLTQGPSRSEIVEIVDS